MLCVCRYIIHTKLGAGIVTLSHYHFCKIIYEDATIYRELKVFQRVLNFCVTLGLLFCQTDSQKDQESLDDRESISEGKNNVDYLLIINCTYNGLVGQQALLLRPSLVCSSKKHVETCLLLWCCGPTQAHLEVFG